MVDVIVENESITIFPCPNLKQIEGHNYVSQLTIWNIKQCDLLLPSFSTKSEKKSDLPSNS